MEMEFLKNVIADQRKSMENKLEKSDIIKREVLDYVSKFLKAPNIVAILGVRRGGKSVFSWLLARELKEKFGYINFDDERLIDAKTEDLNKVLQAFYELYGEADLLIFDEIQNVFGWELFVNRLRVNKKIIVTGSSSKMLSGELATKLTGRYIDFTLYPFSFRETLLHFKPDIHLTEDIAKTRRSLDAYFKGSGFPEFGIFGSEIITRIYSDIVEKDCLDRHDIREKQTFREMAKYLIANFSSEFTYSKLAKLFGIKDVNTIKNYINYLKDAFLIIVLERYSPKLKQQIIAPKKSYVIDQGFCNFISFSASDNVSKTLENLVCIELLRKKSIHPMIEIYYWKDHQQREIDFVLKEKEKIKQLIQVSYDINDANTKEREIRSLLRASEELKCSNLLIITWDHEAEEEHEGKKVIFIPLWKWMLDNKQ